MHKCVAQIGKILASHRVGWSAAVTVRLIVTAIFSLFLCVATHATPVSTTATESGSHALQADGELHRWQAHQMYLRTLNDLHKAVEKELEVVRLMRDCEAMGLRCTGWGIAEGIAHKPQKVEDGASRGAGKPQRPKAAASRPLPEVLAVYRGRVSLLIGRRKYEVAVGDRVEGYQVEGVKVDGVVVRQAGRKLLLPLRWLPSEKVSVQVARQSP